jgi:hypothetical protein
MIAAKIKDKTIAYFLNEINCLIVKTPKRTSSKRITGSWKAKPKAKINVIINDRYSFILACNVILSPSD